MTNARGMKLGTDKGHARLPVSAIVADKRQVNQAVARIRVLLSQTLQKGCEQVGQYLLDTFYGGSVEAYLSAHPNKHVSLRMLMDRCGTVELPVNKVFLARAIQMAALVRQLPRQSRFMSLPPSHRYELLKVKSVDTLEQLASKAVESNMSVQKLRDTVRREFLRTKSSRGRKPIPTVIRSINVCMRTLRDEGTGKLIVQRDDVAELTDEQVEAARALVGMLQKNVDDLARLLS